MDLTVNLWCTGRGTFAFFKKTQTTQKKHKLKTDQSHNYIFQYIVLEFGRDEHTHKTEQQGGELSTGRRVDVLRVSWTKCEVRMQDVKLTEVEKYSSCLHGSKQQLSRSFCRQSRTRRRLVWARGLWLTHHTASISSVNQASELGLANMLLGGGGTGGTRCWRMKMM